MYSSLYTIKWLMQCFLDRVSASSVHDIVFVVTRLFDMQMYCSSLNCFIVLCPGAVSTRSQAVGYLHTRWGETVGRHELQHDQDAQK